MAAPRLNRSSPLTRGRVFAAAGGYATNLVTGQQGTYIGSMGQGSSKWGQAFESRATTGNGIWFPDLYMLPKVRTQHSVLLVMDVDSAAVNGRYYNTPHGGFPPHVIMADNSVSDITSIRVFEFTAGNNSFNATATTGAASQPRLWTRNGTNVKIWVNGVRTDNSAAYDANEMNQGTANDYILFFNNEKGDTSLGVDGRLFLAAIWNRELTPAESVMVTKRPLDLLERPFYRGPYNLAYAQTTAQPNLDLPLLQAPHQANVYRM